MIPWAAEFAARSHQAALRTNPRGRLRNSWTTAMFVRFVAGADTENAFRLEGIIMAASELIDLGMLDKNEAQWLQEVFAWFNKNLPCPPFRRKLRSGEWTKNAVCWFHDRAGEPLKRIWDIVAILEEHGTSVRLVTTRRPGKIVYSDWHQIVAETPYWA